MLINSTEQRLDPRVVRTRRSLEEAFHHIMATKGFEAMTVKDLTEQAGVNRATFYAHFEDKFALLKYVIERLFAEAMTQFSAEIPFSPVQLQHLVLIVCDFFGQFSSRVCTTSDRQFDPMIEKIVQRQVYDLLLDWFSADACMCEASVPLDVIATPISWGIVGAGLAWSKSAVEASAEIYTEQVAAVLVNGINGTLASPMATAQSLNGYAS